MNEEGDFGKRKKETYIDCLEDGRKVNTLKYTRNT